MQKYQDSVLSANASGDRPVGGASVRVTLFPGGGPATIYSDNGVTPIIQPISTGPDGSFAFYAADGHYNISVSGPGIASRTITDVLLQDSAATLALSTAAATVGSVGPSTVQTDLNARPTSATLAASSGSSLVGDGTTTVADRLSAINLASYTALRAYAGANQSAYITGYLVSANPSGTAGLFTRDDTDTTSADNGGTIIVASNGKRWKRAFSGHVDGRWFGASASTTAATNDASFAAAITYCAANGKALYVPGQGYSLSANLNLNGVRVFGDVNPQSSATFTFTSSVDAPTYAITLNNGELDRITLKCSGTGNGIDAALCVRRLGLSDVYVEASTATTAGSIGVSFGTDGTPGTQSITTTFRKVVERNFDIGFYMRAYSNSNVYEDFYALNTTVGAGTQGTAGFKVSAHGCTFINPRAESNYVDGFRFESDSYSNTAIGLWLEGTNTNNLSLDGVSNIVLNPFYGLNYQVLNQNSKVIGRNGTNVPFDSFTTQGGNHIPNAGAEIGTTGWSGTPVAVSSANQIWGFNTFEFTTTSGSSLQAELTITDPKVLNKMKGKAITMLGVGQNLDPSYKASVRLMVDTGSGYAQIATGNEFDSAAPSISKVATILSSSAVGVKLRVFGSGNPASTVVARMALPMLYVGSDINDVRERPASDGANTFYGNQTLNGGSWNTAHAIFGTYHLWVEVATGKLRIKSGAPTSDSDGTVVGTQT